MWPERQPGQPTAKKRPTENETESHSEEIKNAESDLQKLTAQHHRPFKFINH